MPVSPCARPWFGRTTTVQICLVEFSVKARYNSRSLRIYMFSNNVDVQIVTEIIGNHSELYVCAKA